MRDNLVRTIGTVTIAGKPVTQSQRPLVATLALLRATGACVDTLIDGMWGEHPPASAKKSAHNQIARLRHSFGGDLIVTSGDRYRLAVPTDIDRIDRIAHLCDRTAVSPNEAHSIAEVLNSWNGEPYADLPEHPMAEAERARLHHLQSRLVETLGVSRLVDPLSDPNVTVVDLMVRTSAEPLHEQAWELLVVALHVAGRRTEALRTYARFRDVLDAELGAAPSQRFQSLRESVDADRSIDPMTLLLPLGGATPLPLLATA